MVRDRPFRARHGLSSPYRTIFSVGGPHSSPSVKAVSQGGRSRRPVKTFNQDGKIAVGQGGQSRRSNRGLLAYLLTKGVLVWRQGGAAISDDDVLESAGMYVLI